MQVVIHSRAFESFASLKIIVHIFNVTDWIEYKIDWLVCNRINDVCLKVFVTQAVDKELSVCGSIVDGNGNYVERNFVQYCHHLPVAIKFLVRSQF